MCPRLIGDRTNERTNLDLWRQLKKKLSQPSRPMADDFSIAVTICQLEKKLRDISLHGERWEKNGEKVQERKMIHRRTIGIRIRVFV